MIDHLGQFLVRKFTHVTFLLMTGNSTYWKEGMTFSDVETPGASYELSASIRFPLYKS